MHSKQLKQSMPKKWNHMCKATWCPRILTHYMGNLDTTGFQLDFLFIFYDRQTRKNFTHLSSDLSKWTWYGIAILREKKEHPSTPNQKKKINLSFQKLPHPPKFGFHLILLCPPKKMRESYITLNRSPPETEPLAQEIPHPPHVSVHRKLFVHHKEIRKHFHNTIAFPSRNPTPSSKIINKNQRSLFRNHCLFINLGSYYYSRRS